MALYLGTARHCYSAIEQPCSSLLKMIPHFTYLRRLLDRCSGANTDWEHCSLPYPQVCMLHAWQCYSALSAHSTQNFDCNLQLSWMGLYGSKTPKPSYLMGVGYTPQNRRCVHLTACNHVCKIFRRWLRGVQNKMTKEKRAEFNTKVVKKKIRANGTVAVSCTEDLRTLP